MNRDLAAGDLSYTHLMVHTRLLRKFAVERYVREKSALVGCHGLVALWGSLVRGLGAARSSPEQPRRAQESQESSRAALGEPRATQNTPNMTLFLATLVGRFALANLVSQARGHSKSSKSAR